MALSGTLVDQDHLAAYRDQLAGRVQDPRLAVGQQPDLYALGAELRQRVQSAGLQIRRFETVDSRDARLLELALQGDSRRLAGFLFDLSKRDPPVIADYVTIQRAQE